MECILTGVHCAVFHGTSGWYKCLREAAVIFTIRGLSLSVHHASCVPSC